MSQIELANNFSEEIILEHQRTVSKEIIKAIDIESNELMDLEVVMHSSKKSIPKIKRDRPSAYIIKNNSFKIVEKLKNMGVDMVELQYDTIINSGSYRVVDFKNNFKIYEKMKMQKVKTEISYAFNNFTKGDIIISMNQKKSNLIAEVLEPEAPNSYVSFGIIKTNNNEILPIYRIKKF